MEHCTNCGRPLSPSARFCANCGAAAGSDQTVVASEETRVAPARPQAAPPRPVRPLSELAARPSRQAVEEPEERVVFAVRPTLLFVKLGYALAALAGVLIIALVATFDRQNYVPLYLLIPFALALLLIPAYYHLRRNTLRYTLTDAKIEIDEGFVSRTTRNIPLSKVQDVTVRATVFQRLLRFGDVIVDNSGAEGGVTVFRNIPDPRRHADLLLRELRRWR
jgi:membrane protein YdbS with pleckstrin-like domain/predicted nucleic acid-binding Zn ribbon protein